VSVRAAHTGDAEAVTALLADLGRPAVAEDPADQHAVLDAHLTNPDARVFVAEDDGAVVGIVSLWLRPRLNWTTLEAWIPDLYVDPAARRRGHGRALLEACEGEARRHGCHRLSLESGHHRTEAHRLYESYGFEHHGRAYQLVLA
jgi:ribosomal protein S18 acetylase RimI-like enzyme